MNTTDHKKLRSTLFNRLLGMATIDPAYQQVILAFIFAERTHNGVRKDGVTPEFYHQLSILGLAFSLHKLMVSPIDVYIAILLHDCAEDYPQTIGYITEHFPNHVKHSLALSKYRYLATADNDKKDWQIMAKSMQEYMNEISLSPILSVVKLLDRLHNLSTMLGVFTPEKIHRYVMEVETAFLPMLKEARQRFPEQEALYELIKSELNVILNTIRHFTSPASHDRAQPDQT